MLLRWKVVMMILRNVVESGVGLSGIHEEEALRKQADGLKSDCVSHPPVDSFMCFR